MILRINLLVVGLVLATINTSSKLCAEPPVTDGVRVLADVLYKAGDGLSEYEKDRCKLDLYLPKDATKFKTLVWFHGGGLKNGDKDGRKDKTDSVSTAQIARSLAAAGIAVVSANYRLSPKVTFPAYIEDAAAAVAWTKKNIGVHGGDDKEIFVGGHSAGGYLALMLGMDEHYLANAGIQVSDVAGFVPVSGQTVTHYTVREERGIGKNNITADEAAPLFFIRDETPPFLVLYGDHDTAAREEENALFVAFMRGAGNDRVKGVMINDRTHGTIASKIVDEGDSARVAILDFISQN